MRSAAPAAPRRVARRDDGVACRSARPGAGHARGVEARTIAYTGNIEQPRREYFLKGTGMSLIASAPPASRRPRITNPVSAASMRSTRTSRSTAAARGGGDRRCDDAPAGAGQAGPGRCQHGAANPAGAGATPARLARPERQGRGSGDVHDALESLWGDWASAQSLRHRPAPPSDRPNQDMLWASGGGAGRCRSSPKGDQMSKGARAGIEIARALPLLGLPVEVVDHADHDAAARIDEQQIVIVTHPALAVTGCRQAIAPRIGDPVARPVITGRDTHARAEA